MEVLLRPFGAAADATVTVRFSISRQTPLTPNGRTLSHIEAHNFLTIIAVGKCIGSIDFIRISIDVSRLDETHAVGKHWDFSTSLSTSVYFDSSSHSPWTLKWTPSWPFFPIFALSLRMKLFAHIRRRWAFVLHISVPAKLFSVRPRSQKTMNNHINDTCPPSSPSDTHTRTAHTLEASRYSSLR